MNATWSANDFLMQIVSSMNWKKMIEGPPLDSTFIPLHLQKLEFGGRRSKRIQIHGKNLTNSRLSTKHLKNIKTFSSRQNLDCNESLSAQPASSKIYRSILSARQYDEFGRPIKGQKLNESSRQVIVRKSTLRNTLASSKALWIRWSFCGLMMSAVFFSAIEIVYCCKNPITIDFSRNTE